MSSGGCDLPPPPSPRYNKGKEKGKGKKRYVLKLISRTNNPSSLSSQPTLHSPSSVVPSTPLLVEGVGCTPSPTDAIGSSAIPSPRVASNLSSLTPSVGPPPSLDVAPTPSGSRGSHSHVEDFDHMTRYDDEFPSTADRPIIQPLGGG